MEANMRASQSFVALVLFTGLAACGEPSALPSTPTASGHVDAERVSTSGRIVVFKSSVVDPGGLANAMARAYGVDLRHILSGTSMAAPHAAGVAALYKAAFGDSAQSVINSWILNNATPNTINGNPPNTNRLMLF